MRVSRKIIYRSLAMIPDTSFLPEKELINDACEIFFHKAMGELDEKERHLVVLHGGFGCSFYQVAVMEHITMKAAHRKYSQVVRKLKQEMMKNFRPLDHICKNQLLWEPS